MSDPSKAVFLSYASQDAEAARRFCEALRAAGVEVWFDQSELRGGDSWDQKIRKQIKECALFVPVISANTQARREGYFRREWKLAVERTHDMDEALPFLLPVVIDQTGDAEAFVPERFREVQWTRVTDGNPSEAFCARVRALMSLEMEARESVSAGSRDAVGTPVLPRLPRAAQPPPEFARAKAIAVLAFANLSHDPENEYFSDGISEELLNVLAKIPGLRVTARTSSFYFKGRNLPVREIARQLDVGYIVEGSVRKAGSRVRITAQLIDAIDDAHLWSETFDRELKDIFAVQDEIAGLITQSLQLRLGVTRRAPKTVDPEAYRLVLEGRRAGISLSEEGFARADELLMRALRIDPTLVSARAELALVALSRCVLRLLPARCFREDIDAAERRAREALDVDPTMGEPHITLADVALLRGQIREAQAEIGVALTRCPESEHLPIVYPFVQYRAGRPDRAIKEMEKAWRRDPLAWLPADQHGLSLTLAGRYDEALAPFERAEQAGAPPVVYTNHALALAKRGQRDEAAACARIVFEPALRSGWSDGFLAFSDGFAARLLAELGARDEAELIVQRLFALPQPYHYSAGMALIALGRKDAGYSVLGDFPQQGLGYVLHFLHGDPVLRGDPRSVGLMEKLGATEAFENMGKVLRGEQLE